MSAVLPPVKENIYIPTPFGFLGNEGNQRAGTEVRRGGGGRAIFLWPKRESLLKSQREGCSGEGEGAG